MRTRGMKKLAMTAGLICFLSGTSMVLADVPAVLDRVSATSQIVIAVRDMDALRNKMKGMAEQIGVPIPQDADDAVTSFLNAPDLSAKGSMAMVLTLPEGMGEPDIVMILPVTDARGFIISMGGTGEGVSGVKMFGPGDESGFAKDLGGGYIAFGKEKESVEKFDGKPGSKGAFGKALGTTGTRVADTADVLLIANVPQMKDRLEEGVAGMKESMEGMAQMMGEQGQQMASMLKLMSTVADAVVRDAEVGIIGLGIDAKGINLDFGTNFKEGSESAKNFADKGGAAGMTSSLPSGDFLFAGSADWSSPGVRRLMKAASDMTKDAGAGADSPMGMAGMSKLANDSDGYAFFIGAADLGAGLFANSAIIYSSKDAAKLRGTWKNMMTEMNGKSQEGMTFKVEYKEDAKEVAGLKAASYSIAFDMDPNNPAAGQMQMVMPMMFGPEGKMAGYAVTTDKHLITTLSKNSELLERVIQSAKGGKGLASDAMVKQTADRLPADRMFEGYIGVKAVMDMAMGVMAMMGRGAEIQTPENLAPIGMGATMTGGGVQLRMHVPTDVIKAMVDAGKAFQGGGNDAGDEPMQGGDEKPRF